MFEFRASLQRRKVDIYKPQLGWRTTDDEMRQAVHHGAGRGWMGGFRMLSCADSGEMDPYHQPGAAKKAGVVVFCEPGDCTEDRIIIDGDALLRHGYLVAQNVAENAADYRLLSARTFPRNLEVVAEFTDQATGSTQVGFSWVRLPDEPMVPRINDDRLMYFASEYRDLGQRLPKPQKLASETVDRHVSVIWRYNLDRLPGRQIRIYVDPTVPDRWRRHVMEGIEAWNPAFEAIGLAGTVRAVLPGDEDWPADYDLHDARYSTISWSVSDEVSSMGIAKVDPRTGEIIKSDIVMSDGWLQAWLADLDHFAPSSYKKRTHESEGLRMESQTAAGARGLRDLPVQLSLLQTAGKGVKETAQLLGEGIRSVVMHETGHILGLRHNFKGSVGVSYECTQNMSCSAEQGLSASVMDYLPMNFPATPENDVHAFTPVIGAYDKLAIRYGYMNLPGNSTGIQDDVPELRQVLRDAEAFGVCYDEDNWAEDPSCQPYDFTADPLRYYDAELTRLADVQRHLLNMSVAPDESYLRYGTVVEELLFKLEEMGENLISWLGGVNYTYTHRGADGGPGHTATEPIAAETQQRALSLFLSLLRPESIGLMPPPESSPFLVTDEGLSDSHIAGVDVIGQVRAMSSSLLSTALSPQRVQQVCTRGIRQQQEKSPVFGCDSYLAELVTGVVGKGLDADSPMEWHLQNVLVANLKSLYANPGLPSEVASNAFFHLTQLSRAAEAASERVGDTRSWEACSVEGEACACTGLVRFGVEHSWSAALPVTASVRCAAEAFGDPKPQTTKRCECLPARPQAQDLLSAHLASLRLDLSEVFCGSASNPCSRPPSQPDKPMVFGEGRASRKRRAHDW